MNFRVLLAFVLLESASGSKYADEELRAANPRNSRGLYEDRWVSVFSLAKSLPKLEKGSSFPLDACQGFCNDDDDCQGSLVCYKRWAKETVPGCSGEGTKKRNYCCDRPDDFLFYVGDDKIPANKFPLGLCEGDCDSHADCQGDLTCTKRQGFAEVPGCRGMGKRGADFCTSPKGATPLPTRSPTSKPTFALTPLPTGPPQTNPLPTRLPTPKPTPALTPSPTGPPRTTPVPTRVATSKPTPALTPLPTRSPSTPLPTRMPTSKPTTTLAPQTPATFRRGDLAVEIPHLGLKVCTGMSARLIARANEAVEFGNKKNSNLKFHSMPDGAAIFPSENDGYVYVSNSEMREGLGGVYGLYFDKEGDLVDYKMLHSGTTRNCSGGRTPWNTWISCEEYHKGQCWQIDPKNQRTPQPTLLGGKGGFYESVAVDNRNPDRPIFYVTEDHQRGALRRYAPPQSFVASWDTLHAQGGSTTYLLFLANEKFTWTENEENARSSQEEHFPNVEGIDFDGGLLYFVSKRTSLLYILHLDNGTYTTSLMKDGLVGPGNFRHSPDQLVRNNEGEYLYMTEDGGKTVGVYAIHKPTGKRYAIFEAIQGKYANDETTGLAFSLDGRKMYAAFQDCGGNSKDGTDPARGCLFEFTRSDGMSFDGSTMSLKFHSL